jgi:hypothetical protein
MKNPNEIKEIEKIFESAKEIILLTSNDWTKKLARLILIFDSNINEEIRNAYKLLHDFNNGIIDSIKITPNNNGFEVLLKINNFSLEIKKLICSYSMYESFIHPSNSKTLFVFDIGNNGDIEDLLNENYNKDNTKIKVKELITVPNQ